MTDKALNYIEVDIPYCSLSHGVAPCRAKLGFTDQDGPQGLIFDGTDQYLIREGGLTGAADGRELTVSLWLFIESGTGATIFAGVTTSEGATDRIKFELDGTNQLFITADNAAGTEILNVNTSALATDRWHHILASFDLTNASNRHLYVNDVSDLTVTTYTNDDMDLTLADWSVGGLADGSDLLTGALAEFWLDFDYVDLSVEANRRLYVDSDIRPVYLGTDGSEPGAQPIIFFGGEFQSWFTNKGTGEGFTAGTSAAIADPGFGRDKCFNTLATCQDRTSFNNVPVTIRFSEDADYYPDNIEAIPSIRSISFSPPVISLGENLGQRGTLTVTFRDHLHNDTGEGFDKYYSERSYDPWSQGSFFGKWRARHLYLKGRSIRLIRGLLGQTVGNMETRHYLIESFDGPTPDGIYTLVAKDTLKLADGDRAMAPVLSNGKLLAAIDDAVTSATLAPSGIGDAEYPASGLIAIGGEEIVSFTRSGDTLTITRGQAGTVAASHDGEDRCQLVLQYSGDSPADIIYDLLTNYTDTPASYITLAEWQAEVTAYLSQVYTAVIAEPTPVKKLISELIEQAALASWWDDVNQKIRLQVLREIVANATVIDEDVIVENSLQVSEQEGKRVTQQWTYYGLRNPLEGVDDTENFRSTLLTTAPQVESDLGQPSIRVIQSRWIPAFGLAIATRVNDIVIARYRIPPRKFRFSLYKFQEPQVQLGGGYRIMAKSLQEADGSMSSVPIQVTRLNVTDSLVQVEAEEALFDDNVVDLVNRVITIDTDTLDFNLRTVHDTLYPEPTGEEDPAISVTCIVNTGVKVGSSSTSTPAFDVGDWPTSIEPTVRVLGRIQGKGGNGSKATPNNEGQEPGGDGGDAFYTRHNIDLELDEGQGEIWGGGGGGSGSYDSGASTAGAGGGGAGHQPGLGGKGRPTSSTYNDGQPGTSTAGGQGGQDNGDDIGGDGGDPGQDGGRGDGNIFDGGDAGVAIDGVSFVTKTGTGDIRGSEIN